jgi:hypothetical protein
VNNQPQVAQDAKIDTVLIAGLDFTGSLANVVINASYLRILFVRYAFIMNQ